MINALGLLEIYGLVAGIEAADAALKSANVRLINYSITQPGLVTLVVEGDLAACRAALDAGSAAASKLGQVICRKEMGRPAKDTEWFVQSFMDEDKAPAKPEAKPQVKAETTSAVKSDATKVVEMAVQAEAVTEEKEVVTQSVAKVPPVTAQQKNGKEQVGKPEDPLVAFLQTKSAKGANLTDMAKHLVTTTDDIKHRIHQYVTQKIVRKKNNRYYMIEDK